MFRKLRIKFIAVNMAMVAAVLAVVFAGICMAEYQRSYTTVQTALTEAVSMVTVRDGEGRFGAGAAMGEPPDDPFVDGFAEGRADAYGDAPGMGDAYGDVKPPRIGRRDDEPRGGASLVPVAVYEVASGDALTVVSGVTTASISSDVLSEAASSALSAVDATGTLGDLGLHYYRCTTETTTYLAFADTAYTSSWQSLAVTLAVAGLGTLAVFFVISLFFSKWALEPVREAWDSQRQFVADASHDLKTPLTVILANASILLKHPQDTIASQSQWVESTQVEAESMQGLVNEMLELAQVEARVNVQHAPLDFSDLVDGEALQFESVAFERGCQMECLVQEGLTVSGDAARLRKMTSTLMENALKYVDSGGSVNVGLERDGKRCKLGISNSGSSIAPEDLPHIFDRFYRTDKARTSGEGGFGLGLAIAREIAREHDGDITCESDAATGTTFTVTLPLE